MWRETPRVCVFQHQLGNTISFGLSVYRYSSIEKGGSRGGRYSLLLKSAQCAGLLWALLELVLFLFCREKTALSLVRLGHTVPIARHFAIAGMMVHVPQ